MTAKYITLTKDKKEVQFFVAGIINEDNTFTGIMHDYTGGGNYEEVLVYKDKWIPTSDQNNEPLEWDEQVEIFNTLSSITVDKIETDLNKIIYFDADVLNYVPQSNQIKYFNDNLGILIDNMLFNIPYGLGYTSFFDGYKITESLEYNKSI